MSWKTTYANSLKTLSLTDLYREQDHYVHLEEKWLRVPHGKTQARLCHERQGIIQNEIEQRYHDSQHNRQDDPIPDRGTKEVEYQP